ncbi:MAG: hypothetical protein GY851_21970 [bacterium]|nr:hypothetical protein [bacterium]
MGAWQHFGRLRRSWAGAFGSVLMARGIGATATVAGIMLMSRHLGRIHYGRLVVLLTVMKVAAELVGPALDTALVRFAARAGFEREGEALPYLRAVLWLKLAVGSVLVVVGAVVSRPLLWALANAGRGATIPPYTITLALLGAAFLMLWAYAQAYLQARQHFHRYAAFEVGGALLRLGFVAAIVLAAGSLQWTRGAATTLFLGAYVLAAGVVAAAAWTQVPRGVLARPTGLSAPMRELWGFAKWVVAACGFTTLAHRADILLITALALPEDAVGDYAGAVQLVLLGDLVILTLFNVLLPKASGLKTREELRRFLRDFRLPALLALAAALPLVALSGVVSRVVLGPEFVETGRLFSLLLVGAVFSLGSAPAGTVLYGLGRSRTIALLEGAKLAGIAFLGWWLAGKYGVFGMAWTMALIRSTIGVATVISAHLGVARNTAVAERTSAPAEGGARRP